MRRATIRVSREATLPQSSLYWCLWHPRHYDPGPSAPIVELTEASQARTVCGWHAEGTHVRHMGDNRPNKSANIVLIINWTTANKLYWNCNQNANVFIQYNAFENIACKISGSLFPPQCVKPSHIRHIWPRFVTIINSTVCKATKPVLIPKPVLYQDRFCILYGGIIWCDSLSVGAKLVLKW